jgi:hypothetical protein
MIELCRHFEEVVVVDGVADVGPGLIGDGGNGDRHLLQYVPNVLLWNLLN